MARITRTWTDSGFVVSVVPPAELARRDFFAPQGDQQVDPPTHAPFARYARSETPVGGDQQVDPPYHIEHDQNQQQQQAPVDSALLEEFAGDDPAVVAEVLAKNPNLTVAEVHEQIAIATERPDVHCPRGLVFDCLRRGQRVTPARRSEPRPDAPRGARSERKPWDTPDSLAAYFAAAAACQRAEHEQECDPPDDATDEELRQWHDRLDAGDTPAEALDALLFQRHGRKPIRPLGGAR